MKNLSLFSSFVLISVAAVAQDYRAFSGAETRLYDYLDNPGDHITSVVVDQVGFDGDFIYRFAHRWMGLSGEFEFCSTPYDASLLGSGLRFTCSNFWEQSLTWRKLRYFQKGDKNGGTPLFTFDFPASFNNPIRLYPNPAADIVTVQLPSIYIPSTLRLIDLRGRTIISRSMDENRSDLDVSTFGPGIYIVEITLQSGGTLTRKLMINP